MCIRDRVTFVVIQFAMGITVLIARYLGEKRPEQIGSVIGGAAIVFTMISIVLFIVMVGFAHPISMPVSYTHLDVYKRQDRTCSGGFGDFTDDTGNLQGRGVCSFYKSDQHLYGAVSYTHLDVYKRQIPD